MKCAILGAGFAGCAVAYYLSQLIDPADISLFDPQGIGGKASAVAAGSLHPFVGAKARLNQMGQEAFQAARELILAVDSLNSSPIILAKGLLRLALTKEKEKFFYESASRYPENQWLTKEALFLKENRLPPAVALEIPQALAIDCKAYLTALSSLFLNRGVRFYRQKITCEEALSQFDTVVLATGAQTAAAKACKALKFTLIKGQLLHFAASFPFKTMLSSDVYLAPSANDGQLIGGATYERHFQDELPDMEKAKKELIPKIAAFFPEIEEMRVDYCQAAVRAFFPDKLPKIGQVKERLFLFSGLGSKGLLYHAFLGKQLAEAIAFESLHSISPPFALKLPEKR